MSYTDEQMRAFSQIAYADFTKAYEYLQATEGGNSFSIQQLAETAKQLDPNVNLDMLYCLKDTEMQNWKIAAVHDTNPQNGFYGCIIETGDGNATLAFRGSEGMDNPEGLIHDWLGSDLGLLDSPQTRQHAEVERFLAKYQDQINSYNSISLTGHSLGGNLSDYATLVSYKYGFDGKIEQSMSLDGPGFSDEFIKLHMQDIARMNDRMTHVKWSWCGGLLLDLPGVAVREVSVSNEANHKDNESDIGTPKGYLYKHDTKYLDIDENGNFVNGRRDDFAYFMDSFSDMLDLLPFGGLITAGVTTLSWLYGSWDAIGQFFSDIAEAFKTTYQNIINGFQNIFHRNADYFKVNTHRLSQDTEEIRAYINRVRNNVDEMFSSVQTLGGMWKGLANEAYTEKFIREKQAIDEYLREIDAYVSRLENDSRNYTACENRALSMISSIRV